MRIRTVKPEFWTDSKIVQLPIEARLFFIGLWNEADDYGWIIDDPLHIKLVVFPDDNFDVASILELLIAAEVIERYEDEHGTLLKVKNWEKHQRVDRPTKSKIYREGSRKLAIRQEERRRLALKYGCPPGGEIDVTCYYCGQPGKIHWFNLKSGKPSFWVTFPGMEIDHVDPESSGGKGVAENLVLACRHCNRSKNNSDFIAFALKNRETSRGVVAGKEGNGKEGKVKELPPSGGGQISFPVIGDPEQKPKATNPEHGNFITRWCESFKKHHNGRDYIFNGGRDGKAVQRLLATGKSTDELIKIAVAAWAKPGIWECDKAVDIHGFAANINAIIEKVEYRPPAKVDVNSPEYIREYEASLSPT